MVNTSAPEGVSHLQSLLRNVAKARLATQSQRAEFEIAEITRSLPVHGHWMAIILVSGPDLRLTFKSHYMSRDAQILAAPIYSRQPQDLSPSQAADFMREFCNLTAGTLKGLLSEQKIETGISLPIVTRGFDEMFSFHSPLAIHDRWMLSDTGCKISCSSAIEIIGSPNLVDIRADFADSSGEIEFL